MHQLWSLERGATALPDGVVRFTLWAPTAGSVTVRVTAGSASGDHPMERRPSEPGVWDVTVEGAGHEVEYGYIVDGHDGRLLPDPVSRWLPHGVHGATRVVDPHAFQWSDDGWRGQPMAELVIYELHVGTFTDEGTLPAAIPHLRDLRDLGVTAVELMPVAQFPGTRNWGYDGVGLYAVQASYGGPVALKQFVDAAHEAGLAVILDVVYNHVGPEGNYLDAFGPYFTHKYRTPWGRALNFDDADSDEVRRWVVENALYWVTEYHVDGLRLDAVHGIVDVGARHLLQELTEAVHRQARALGREVVVIAESDLNDPRIVRAVVDHGLGLDAQWSDDFHHAVHALLTGEVSGYYADFGGVGPVAQALEEPFVYAGTYSPSRRRRHGASSAGLPRDRFVVAIQNHDQVGNRAAGERLAALLPPPRLRMAAALLLLSPYVPLLFMGEEYGELNPFQYFTSHDDTGLAEAVRTGRRREFAAFGWPGEVPDPQVEDTFVRSRLDRSRMERSPHAELLALYRDLLQLRQEEPMLRPAHSRHWVTSSVEQGWITLLREPTANARYSGVAAGAALLAMFNCSDEPVRVPVPELAWGSWTLRLSTEAVGYGGGGLPRAAFGGAGAERDGPKRLLGGAEEDASGGILLAPWSAALYQRHS
jgi:maltooligosyltrehalose trehalohydrolase